MQDNGWQSNCAHLRTGLRRHGTPIKCPHCQIVTYCSEACRVSEWNQHHALFCHSIPYKKRLESRCQLYVKMGNGWLVTPDLSKRVRFPTHEISLFSFGLGCVSCERKLEKKDLDKMKRILNGQTYIEQVKSGVLIRYELCPECLLDGKDICLRTYQNVLDCNEEISRKSLLLYYWKNQFEIPPDLVRLIWFLFVEKSECIGHEIVQRKEPKSGISLFLEKIENLLF